MEDLGIIISAAASSFTVLSTTITSYWVYRVRMATLATELEIARLHDCLDTARTEQVANHAEQIAMHAENLPVLQATLATVEAIKSQQTVDTARDVAREQ